MDDTSRAAIATDGGFEKEIEDARALLTSVRRTLALLLVEVQEGDAGALKEIAGKQSELESALRRVFDTEQRYHEWRNRQAGAAAPGDIDFDLIRHEIGCRLHRLRECCKAE
jgi:hypothetical protein